MATMTTSDHIDTYVKRYEKRISDVCDTFEKTYSDTGFSGELIQNKNDISYILLKDDLSGEYSLEGIWKYASGYKQGSLLFHPDGNFFCEFDVVKAHPVKRKWFVEAITVWGKDSVIKAEAKLIPALE